MERDVQDTGNRIFSPLFQMNIQPLLYHTPFPPPHVSSSSNICCVPLPWWTSQSRMRTRSGATRDSFWAWRATSAAVLKKQNPQGKSLSAWWPGGRTIATPLLNWGHREDDSVQMSVGRYSRTKNSIHHQLYMFSSGWIIIQFVMNHRKKKLLIAFCGATVFL